MAKRILGVVASILCACTPPSNGLVPEGDGPDPSGDAPTRPACTPALSLAATPGAVNPFALATLAASGGTGRYQFAIVDPGANAAATSSVLHPVTGVFLAGTDIGDVSLRVEDSGCAGEATATLAVLQMMNVQPQEAELPLDIGFNLEVLGGSGQFVFTLLEAGSGGSLSSAGAYRSGTTDGRDVIEVRDSVTGEKSQVDYTVTAAAQLRFAPERLVIPVGESVVLRVQGGTGQLRLEFSTSGVSFDEDSKVLSVSAPGEVTATATDRFSGQTAPLMISGVAPLPFVARRFGDRSRIASMAFDRHAPTGERRALDINNDGFPDLVLGQPESDLRGYGSGAVFIFMGAASGYKDSPDRVITRGDRSDGFGYALAAGDFDKDGLVDLAIGAATADAGLISNGSVSIYYGEQGKFFADEPRVVIAGDSGLAHLGSALCTCDFDGDGDLDLAIGSQRDEDREQDIIAYDSGSVHIYLGQAGEFITVPDQKIYGGAPDAQGVWQPLRGMYLGQALDCGDIDGDGRHDLAVSSIRWADDTSAVHGAVFIYPGRASADPIAGGISDRPVRVIGAFVGAAAGQFGRAVGIADLNGDGFGDLAVGEPFADVERVGGGNALTNAGTMWLYRGGPLASTPATLVEPETSGTAYSLQQSSALLGSAFDFARPPGATSGPFGVCVGAPVANAGGLANNGAVFCHAPGQSGNLPDPVTEPTAAGVAAGDEFGQAFAIVGDLDQDSQLDIAAMAGFADEGASVDVGALHVVFSGPAAPHLAALPGLPAGHRFAESVAFVGDVNRDGKDDLLVGATHDLGDWIATYPRGVFMGASYIYPGVSAVEVAEPIKIGGFAGHTDSDRMGYRVASAGDFNGDGFADFAVMNFTDSRPGSYSTTYYDNSANCVAQNMGQSGSITIYLSSADPAELAQPDFVYWGVQSRQRFESMAGGFDFDGDGFDDIVAGSYLYDAPGGGSDQGAAFIIGGRAAGTAGKITVLCAEIATFVGAAHRDRLGKAVVGMQDIDGDGCDEVAVGAYTESLADSGREGRAQGTVRIFYGAGSTGCPGPVRITTLASGQSAARAGWSLAAADIDAHAGAELAIGLPRDRRAVGITGSVVVLPSQYLTGLPAMGRLGPGNVVPNLASDSLPFLSPVLTAVFSLAGNRVDDLFGTAVALLGSTQDGTAVVVVGAQDADVSGANSGGAFVYRYGGFGLGLEETPSSVFVGQGSAPGGRLGEALAAGNFNGKPAFLVGGSFARGEYVDTGAAFLVQPQ